MWYEISKKGLFYVAERWLNVHFMYQVYKNKTWKALVKDAKTGKVYEVVSTEVNDRVRVTHELIESDNIVIDEKGIEV
jgi:hypothetical protein